MAKFTEKQLISKLQELRQIKPSNDWVVFTKEQVFGKEKTRPEFSFISFIKEIQKGERFVFQHKPAFAFALSLLILIGVFGFAQNSVPGDSLFSLKKITEKSQAVFVSERNQAKYDLEMAGKRLDDLFKIAEENEVKNLAPAINEYQESISKAVESLAKAENSDIIEEIANIEQKVKTLGILGIEIGNIQEEIYKIYVEREMNDLEGEILEQVQQDYEAGDYYDALEKILLLINNNN